MVLGNFLLMQAVHERRSGCVAPHYRIVLLGQPSKCCYSWALLAHRVSASDSWEGLIDAGLCQVRLFVKLSKRSYDLHKTASLQGKLLVGGELAEPEGRLSKAQKKNMKRMEKKVAARASTDTSVASSEV